MRPGQLFILESTTYPGTTDEVLKPLLEKNGLKAGVDFHLAFSPEREDPGNKNFNTKTIPKIVGGHTPACLEVAQALYGSALKEIVPVVEHPRGRALQAAGEHLPLREHRAWSTR